LLAGGDVLSPAKVREYLEMPGHGRLINGYGPTENTTFTCCGVFDRPGQIDDSVPIGRPISGTSVYILSKQGEPVPVGVVGELYAGGDGLAHGYLNARELTETRFVADPFSLDARARLYKTGDLARWRSDGNIEFVGRADHQVKIRGYRIELGEIEHALRRCHGVSDAAVVASVTKSGDKMLLAYLVAATEEAPASAALRAELAEMLPEYMIPGCYRLLDQLPLGSNGKLDRTALERLDGVELPEGGERVVASTELERRMVEIWKELLGKDRIGVHDNFFELGGHSIQAAQLAVEIEKLVGQKLPISALFESPTIASLARRLSDEQWAPAWSSLVPLQPMGSRPPLFVVHGVGGDVYGFLGLAKDFAPEQPVYGIQAVGLDGSVPRHASVEEMATHYIKEIRSFQPDGPYHLCGYSMGGLIAYEMARQLHHQGQTAILILLDTFPTAPIPVVFHAFNIISRLPGRFLVHFRRFWAIPMGKRASYIRGRLYALRNLILRNRAKPHLLKKIDSEGRTTEIKANESDYFVEVSRSYRLSSYSGSLDYFACEDSGFSWKLYWGFLTSGRVRFHRAPVQHGEILAPHITPELAQAIETILKQADQGTKKIIFYRATSSRSPDTQ
jgi:thioesterase domain-containing protein/acyl carrier protein